MNSVLSLSGFSDQTWNYLVIRSTQIHELQDLISPRVMKWSEETLIIDLQDTYRYWCLQAEKSRLPLQEFFEKIMPSQARTVVCQHPWQGLMLLSLMESCPYKILSFNSSYAESLLRTLSWESWICLLERLDSFFEESKREVGKRRQLRSFLQRMKIQRVSELRPLSHPSRSESPSRLRRNGNFIGRSSFQKRFGHLAGLAWGWTIEESFENGGVGLNGFPWVPFVQKKAPFVKRNLEYPVDLWEVTRPLLKEDLQVLCEQSLPYYRTSKIDWVVHLYNLDCIRIPICFRNPHSLHEGAPDHETPLQQAEYGFSSFYISYQEFDFKPIVAWELTLSEQVLLSEPPMSLFPDTDWDWERFTELENKLPIEFEKYRTLKSFFPFEKSGEAVDELGWSSGGLLRPFFLYPSPIELEGGVKGDIGFLENVSGEWWRGERDWEFYKRREGKKSYWIARQGQLWMEYGQYD